MTMYKRNGQENNGQAKRQSDGGEELYRLIAAHSTEIISKHTSEGVYTYVSPACRTLLGYESNELVGRSIYEFVYPEDLEHVKGTHATILDHSDICSVSYRMRRKDGSCIWFETTYHTGGDPQTSEVVEIIAVSRDVTEHKRAEEALRESQETLRKSEEFHRFAVEAGRIGTWDLDLQIEEYVISPKMAELMGYSFDQTTVPGSQWRDSVVLEDRTLVASALAASIENDAPFDLEFRISLKDGTVRWLYSRGSVARDPSGKALRVHGASIDISGRKRAEEQVLFHAHLLDQVQAAVIATDLEGVVTYWNAHAESLYGFSCEETLGRNISELTVGPTEASIAHEIMERLRGGEVWEGEFTVQRKDGSTFPAHVIDSLIYDAQGRATGIVGVSTDITERKQTEEELRRSNRRIVNTLESITEEFIALDYQWRYTYINERALHRIRREKGEQLTREELLGRNAWELYPEFVGSVFYRELHRALREHKPAHFEGYSPVSDRWFETHAYPSEDGVSVYSRDTTERKRAEEKLRESEVRLRRAIEIETVGVIFFRTDGTITDANDAFLRMSGHSREDLAEGLVRWDEMTPPEWMAHSLKAIEEFESTGRTVPYEKEYIRKDGSCWWGLFAARRLDEEEGVEFIIDITDSKQAEGEIRFRKAMLEAQTEASIDGILTVSPERKMISYNQRFVEMWDIPEEVLQTRSDEAAVEAIKDKVVDPQAYLKRVSYLYDHPNDDSGEEILLTDGRTFEHYSAPVTGPDGTYYGRVWYFRDITRRKRAEESLLEIRAAERRRIARDLHDAVLQDLAGTLQGIQALQLELQSAEEQKADLKQESDALRRAVSRLRGAIHDLREENDQSFIRAIESLVEYTRQLAPECQVKLNVQDDFPQELPEAIKMELLRIVQEALTNARQHSKAQWIGVKLYKPQEKKVCLRVKDDGRGFDSETVHKGLGLLGMQERTEAFGGELEIQSEKGQGTMISVTVPL